MARQFKVAGYKLVGALESTMPDTREDVIDLKVRELTEGMTNMKLKKHLTEAVTRNVDSKRNSLLIKSD